MKIAVINTSIFAVPLHGYGGLEIIAHQQAEGLAARGHDVTLYAAEGSRCDHAKVRPIGKPGQWSEQMAYDSYWNELPNYDAVVDHSWQKFSVILKMEGKLKAPTLLWMHAPIHTMYQQLPPIEVKGCCFVCISKDQQSHFEGLHGRAARYCYNGVNHEYYRPLEVPRTNRFLFLARFSSIKGPDTCIEACKKADACLDMIGDTTITQEPELLEKCKREADGKQIKIVGGQSRSACVHWFSQANCLLHLCPKFREPFGLSPVESMLCGTPVVAWNYGALKETVKEGTSGTLVSSMDEAVEVIKHCRDNPPTAQDRERCREWAVQFSLDNMVRRVEALCQEAIESPW